MWQNKGLNFKAAFGIVVTMLVILGILFIVLSQHFKSLLWQSAIQKSEDINAIAESLLIDAMMDGRKDRIEEELQRLGESVGSGQLYSITVYDDQYQLTSFASGFAEGPTIAQKDMPTSVQDPSCWGCHQLAPGERPSLLATTINDQKIIRNSVPLYNQEACQSCHGTGVKVLGDVMVDFSQAEFDQSYSTVLIGLGGGLFAAIILVTLIMFQVLRRIVLHPLEGLVKVAGAVSQGDLNQQIAVHSTDEIGILSGTFNRMIAQLRELISSLEQRVADRTKALATNSEVSRRLSTILNTQRLVREVVEQLQSAFGYYHVHIYLIDPATQHLVLAGGTGEAGQMMLHRGHHLQLGQGLVGKAAETQQPVLVVDVEQAQGWLPNPLLPDTRSEAAVPILLGNKVLGVLDVQHDIHYGLSQQDIDLLQAIANQVAIALQNAQAYERTQRSAERQSQGSVIAQRIQQATSVDEVLRTAVEGLGTTLHAQRIGVELRTPTERDSAKSN